MVEPPLFIRLCQSFVDNLGIILKTAFVFGCIFLVQDLLTGLAETRQAPPRSTQILEPDRLPDPVIDEEPAEEELPKESFLSDGVQHALNCTFTDYRNAHYDECVDEPSDVYRLPPADPNDRGYLERNAAILFASAVIAEQPRDL